MHFQLSKSNWNERLDSGHEFVVPGRHRRRRTSKSRARGQRPERKADESDELFPGSVCSWVEHNDHDEVYHQLEWRRYQNPDLDALSHVWSRGQWFVRFIRCVYEHPKRLCGKALSGAHETTLRPLMLTVLCRLEACIPVPVQWDGKWNGRCVSSFGVSYGAGQAAARKGYTRHPSTRAYNECTSRRCTIPIDELRTTCTLHEHGCALNQVQK